MKVNCEVLHPDSLHKLHIFIFKQHFILFFTSPTSNLSYTMCMDTNNSLKTCPLCVKTQHWQGCHC